MVTAKEKVKIPRQKMPEQEGVERNKNFFQVNLGFDADLAMKEAQRCIMCKKPACVPGCPVGIDIPGFIELIARGEFTNASRKIKEANALPAICGRVCPQETQCEGPCAIGKIKGNLPVAIGHLERFAADWERSHNEVIVPEISNWTGKKVAVIGAGPAGLTAAAELARMGNRVTIFEALHKEGGVLVYGIPEFRLPKDILRAEVDYVKAMGVEFRTNFVVGKTATLDDLLSDGFNAAFVGTGAGLPNFMNIPGENLIGVYSANEFLTRSNLMKAYLWPEYDTPIHRPMNAAVIGGGNTAMDAVRTAKRLGAEHAYLVYRRSRDEMPARLEERKHAEEEGIEFMILTLPRRVIGDEKGRVKAIECIKMTLGEPDKSGRRRPIPLEGTEFTLDVDTVVVAVGNSSNPLIPKTTPDIKVNEWGNIIINTETGETSKKGVFAGGDITRGGATVILAMGDGKASAKSIHRYLQSLK